MKDLLNHTGGQVSSSFFSALAGFATLVLEGRTPPSVCFGATLTALNKKGGGVRPGCTLRRLVAKIAGNKVRDDMVALLAPRQLGYGVEVGLKLLLM